VGERILAALLGALLLLRRNCVAAQSGGDALLFVGTYDKSILVIDEATERVTERFRCAPASRARSR
jgi:hypothetical protein